MITVSDARKLIQENSIPSKIESQKLDNVRGRVLAEDVHSIIDTPPFNQSAMDGYAFSYKLWDGKSSLNVIGEIQAGNYSSDKIKPFEAIRIYTGAALPSGADTVVMQENVISSENMIKIIDEQLIIGSNVRLMGSQLKKGEVALHKGHILTPASISFLAGNGINNVKIYSNPKVSIIVTGKELVQPGNPVTQGKIFESNSFGIKAALNQLNIEPVSTEVLDDNETEIVKAVNKQMQSDILIISGGVSAGNYDLVSSALEKCGIGKVLHKVKQKPGKPFYFGKLNHTLVFGLPGNPAAALTCFYEYIVPAISSITKINYFKNANMPLGNDFRKKPGLTYFLKGKTSMMHVNILNNQESYMMNSFAMADCIIELDEEKEYVKKGDLVNIIMIN